MVLLDFEVFPAKEKLGYRGVKIKNHIERNRYLRTEDYFERF
jgi:hypothetical protein